MTRAAHWSDELRAPDTPAPAPCEGCGTEVEHGAADEHPLCGGDHCAEQAEQDARDAEEAEAMADLERDPDWQARQTADRERWMAQCDAHGPAEYAGPVRTTAERREAVLA